MDYYSYIDYMIVKDDVNEKVSDFYQSFDAVAKYLSKTPDEDNNTLTFRVYENLAFIAKSDSIAEIKKYINTLSLLLEQINDKHCSNEQNLEMQICETKNLFVKLSLILKLKKENKLNKILNELNSLCINMDSFVDQYLKELEI